MVQFFNGLYINNAIVDSPNMYKGHVNVGDNINSHNILSLYTEVIIPLCNSQRFSNV